MKKWAVLLLLVACRKDGPEPGPVLGQEFTLTPNTGTRLPETRPEPASDEDFTLKFRLLSVRDSRCPRGNTCASAGSAVATFQLIFFDQTATDSLCLGDCPRGTSLPAVTLKTTDSTRISFRSKTFRVELRAIDSEAVTGKPPGATFLVR